MSTVALRGILAYDETTNEWSWAGRWLFGDCVPVPVSPAAVEGNTPNSKAKSASKNKQKDTSQPFLYKWQEASDPSAIPVPSLNVKIIGVEEEREEEEEQPEAATPAEKGPNLSTQSALDNDSSKSPGQILAPSNKILAPVDDGKSESKSDGMTVGEGDGVAGKSDLLDTSAETVAKIDAEKSMLPTPTPKAPNDPKGSTSTDANNDGKQTENSKHDKVKNKGPNPITEPQSTNLIPEANAKTKTKIASTEPGAPPTSVTGNNEKNQMERIEKDNASVALPVAQQSKDSISNDAGENKADGANKEEVKYVENQKKTEAPIATTTPMIIEPSNDSKPSKAKAVFPAKITFTSIMPKFLNAADKYNDIKKEKHCPSSGQWKGYFENIIPGKKSGRSRTPQPPQIQKIDETFHLFLNATPSTSEDSQNSNDTFVNLFAFETATKDHIPKIINKPEIVNTNDGSIPAAMTIDASSDTNDSVEAKKTISLVQVRGCGENEFGTFEIMGYLDLNTMVMEIQRQYVVTEVPAASPPAVIRRRRSADNSDSIYEGPRPHSTRKRNPTWKRASYDPEDDRRRKRSRTMSAQKHGSPTSRDPITGNIIASSDGTPFTNSSNFPFSSNPKSQQPSSGVLLGKFEANSTSIPMSTTSGSSISPSVTIGLTGRGAKSRLVLPTHSNMTGADSGGRRRSSSTGALRTKRRSSSMGKSASSSASTKSGSTYIRLPSVGDPKKARWRAAHFLYYQRDDPEQRAQLLQQQQQQLVQSGNNADHNGTTANANKVAAPKPKYVIYEGEMVDSKREGRGICLFTDGTLYEGEWKRNKEHGYGKLMSSDRKQIIYEGEWERGRMQGTGTYYYGTSDPLKPGSRYTGEFRENLRNGIGRYFLDDGSVYDGQWRDGVMNGLGVFTWPDKSMYDGVWKDGKRNGQGLLKKADGFLYDGQWVNNTMEGRGSAIYPNGQKYEGSFSNGRREGRGTIVFTNGAVYEGRFRDDAVDGQGTMKMSQTMIVPREDKAPPDGNNVVKEETKADDEDTAEEENKKEDFMIPISFQSDMTRILTKTGFM